MSKYYLAVDIGASSGRHMLAHKEGDKMVLEEIYRFSNSLVEKNGELCWDVDDLFGEIRQGMKRCAEIGKIPYSMGIDTWAVDFVLLDKEGHRIGNAVSYRDTRTNGMDELVYQTVSEKELYKRTGIQKQKFNTIYQLMALKQRKGELLEKAGKMLMIPDYFAYLLTGVAVTEYTNATTTQLVCADTKQWDLELIGKLGLPEKIFQKIVPYGTEIGRLRKEIQEEVGFDCKVVLSATHDTASAVAAVPAQQEENVYISSGTWSLMGTELLKANCSETGRKKNFTNEGGYNDRFRYLKNIMGLWMIQSVKKEIGENFGYGEICRMASEERINSIVDCNADRFLKPENMTCEIQKACEEMGQQVPEGLAQVAAVIYNSLAQCYAETIRDLEELTGKKYEQIHIVGGGSNADYLNQLTANASARIVLAGPTEATAIGNVLAQMIADGAFEGLKEARECVSRSFPIKIYKPE